MLHFGTRYFGTEALSGTFEYGRVFGRADYEQNTFMFLPRGDF